MLSLDLPLEKQACQAEKPNLRSFAFLLRLGGEPQAT